MFVTTVNQAEHLDSALSVCDQLVAARYPTTEEADNIEDEDTPVRAPQHDHEQVSALEAELDIQVLGFFVALLSRLETGI